MENYKQVILVRKDLKISKAKLSVQVAHASTESALKSKQPIIDKWKKSRMKKVVLKVEDEKRLREFKKKFDNLKIVTALITDAGKTFFKEPATTCLGAGPDEESKIDKITKKLKLL